MTFPRVLFAPILDIAGKIFDRVIPDKAAAERAKAEFAAVGQAQEFQLAVQQIVVNAKEAEHPTLFVAGWRPFVGWTGACAFAYVAIVEPFARFIAQVGFGYAGAFPEIDTTLTMQVLLGILGLGGLRTYEKQKRVAAK